MHMVNAHDHHHDHGGRNAYFLDQLCTIAIAAAYAGAVLVMFYSAFRAGEERSILNLIAPWIQWLLLGGGVLLLLLTILRAIAVWQASKQLSAHHHHHDHGHDHSHDPGHDHDHGWSPLRYIPLVVPLVLILGLGLPDDRMIRAYERALEDRTAPSTTPLLGAGPAEPAGAFAVISSAALVPMDGGLAFSMQCMELASQMAVADHFEEQSTAPPDALLSLADLELIANDAGQRDHWKHRRIEVEGEFSPASEDGRFFRVVRFRVNCCLNDARPAFMLAAIRKEHRLTRGTWVATLGRLDFANVDGKWYPVMRVYQLRAKKTPANPYLS